MITWTPFIASALLVSRFVIAALCTGERNAFTQSVPGIRTSSTNTVCPVDVGDTVVAGDARADRLHATPPRFVIAVPAAVTVRSNESPRAAAPTASMILT